MSRTTAFSRSLLRSASLQCPPNLPSRLLPCTTRVGSSRFSISVTHIRSASNTLGRFDGPTSPPQKTKTGPLENGDITAEWIQLVNPRAQTHPDEARLLAPARTIDVLARIDTTKTILLQVSGALKFPCASLVNKAEHLASIREAKIAAKAQARKSSGASSPKEIRMTWALTENDLDHKLKAGIVAMENGARITVVIATPPGRLGNSSRSKGPDEKKKLVAMVQAKLETAGGVKIKEEFEGAGVLKVTQEWERKNNGS